MRLYLVTFAKGTRPPHTFQAISDAAAVKLASGWHGVVEVFRRTEHGYDRVHAYWSR